MRLAPSIGPPPAPHSPEPATAQSPRPPRTTPCRMKTCSALSMAMRSISIADGPFACVVMTRQLALDAVGPSTPTRLHPARHDHAVRRAQRAGWHGDRPQHAAPPASGVHPFPQPGRGRGAGRKTGSRPPSATPPPTSTPSPSPGLPTPNASSPPSSRETSVGVTPPKSLCLGARNPSERADSFSARRGKAVIQKTMPCVKDGALRIAEHGCATASPNRPPARRPCSVAAAGTAVAWEAW